MLSESETIAGQPPSELSIQTSVQQTTTEIVNIDVETATSAPNIEGNTQVVAESEPNFEGTTNEETETIVLNTGSDTDVAETEVVNTGSDTDVAETEVVNAGTTVEVAETEVSTTGTDTEVASATTSTVGTTILSQESEIVEAGVNVVTADALPPNIGADPDPAEPPVIFGFDNLVTQQSESVNEGDQVEVQESQSVNQGDNIEVGQQTPDNVEAGDPAETTPGNVSESENPPVPQPNDGLSADSGTEAISEEGGDSAAAIESPVITSPVIGGGQNEDSEDKGIIIMADGTVKFYKLQKIDNGGSRFGPFVMRDGEHRDFKQ